MNGNQYEQEWRCSLPCSNNFDCFTIDDSDQDGKHEFAFKGINFRIGIIVLSIFESNGINSYQVITSFDFPFYAFNYAGGYSASADLDGDSIPEMEVEACEKIYIIKTSRNDSFYDRDSLPGNDTDSSVRILDVDRNGINDIVISGGNETRIYEYSPEKIAEKKSAIPSSMHLLAQPNPFSKSVRISFGTSDKKTIRIYIYDLTGRLVKTLKTTGANVMWRGEDEVGKLLPPGIYFVCSDKDSPNVFGLLKVIKYK